MQTRSDRPRRSAQRCLPGSHRRDEVMTPSALLDILCCPETHQPLRRAVAELVAKLNQQVDAGTLKNRSGKPVSSPLDSGLIREDGQFLYPVRNDIPVMLVGEAIPIS